VSAARPTYWLTRFVLLRLLGFVYLAAFLSAATQLVPLIGHDGLLPVAPFLDRVAGHAGGRWAGFLRLPSLFWLDASDRALLAVSWTGVALSALVLAGAANALVLFALWALYTSIVNVGQDWYGYGWEIQLLETGFLAVFLCPLLDWRPFPRRPPPTAVFWLGRWLVFRVMLGAGMIKLRGDACWRRLTCLDYHYETQPIPNPLSRWFHLLPHGVHAAGVALNHVVEVAAPWLVFWPRLARHVAGVLMIVFQAILIASGNLSFLNWLTIVPIVACFDDGLLARCLPARLARAAERAAATAVESRGQRIAVTALVLVVAVLSVDPVLNLFARRQIMNTSFDRLALVNTYGAFGSVGRVRDEIVFEGSDAADPGDDAAWKAYEFPCKPGDPARRPCVVSPLQPRLAWQLWFAAMSTPERYPWTLHLVAKLLAGDPGVRPLLERDPFPEHPPRWVRARYYRYRFAPPGTPGGLWWERTDEGLWLPALSAADPRLRRFLAAYGWGPPAFDSPGGNR
jgi:hypothetical protein